MQDTKAIPIQVSYLNKQYICVRILFNSQISLNDLKNVYVFKKLYILHGSQVGETWCAFVYEGKYIKCLYNN